MEKLIIPKEHRGKMNVKKAAKAALLILQLKIVLQLIAVLQTKYQLVSPLIPDQVFWEIAKQLVFHAMIFAIGSIAGLVLYFYEKYLFVVIFAVLLFIIDRFIHL